MSETILEIRSLKITAVVPDAIFPRHLIPAKGTPGSAKARIPLRLRTADGVEVSLEPAAKALQKTLEIAEEHPGGFWVVQGAMAAGGQLPNGMILYQKPKPIDVAAPTEG